MSDDKDNVRRVHGMIRDFGVDAGGGALGVALELRGLLSTVIDNGTSVDYGGGLGSADLWFTVGGVEYSLCVAPAGTMQVFSAATARKLVEFWQAHKPPSTQ